MKEVQGFPLASTRSPIPSIQQAPPLLQDCPNFEDDSSIEELYCPDGYTFVNDQFVQLSIEHHDTQGF